MEFRVEDRVFASLPTACFAVVFAYGLDNSREHEDISRTLEDNIFQCQQSLENVIEREFRLSRVIAKHFGG